MYDFHRTHSDIHTQCTTSTEHILAYTRSVRLPQNTFWHTHVVYDFHRTHSDIHTYYTTSTAHILTYTRSVRLPQNTFWHTHVLYDFNRTHTSQIAQMKEFFGGSQIWIPNMSNRQPPLQNFQSCRCVCVSMFGCVGVCVLMCVCAFVCVCGAGFALWVPNFFTGVW